MIIEKGIKINKIGISVSSDRPYFEIQFDDTNVERVYLSTSYNVTIAVHIC
jgi:hypothetical protein